MLFHISETADIPLFEPRLAAGEGESLVWAIHRDRLHNYLLPRDCPRVTYYGGPHTSAADTTRFLGASAAVVAIEHAWYERARDARLYCYELPAQPFDCKDAGAGYYVSREPVAPLGVTVIADPISEMLRRGVELRVMRSLWPLHDAVAASTVQFSMIRMRNAAARDSMG